MIRGFPLYSYIYNVPRDGFENRILLTPGRRGLTPTGKIATLAVNFVQKFSRDLHSAPYHWISAAEISQIEPYLRTRVLRGEGTPQFLKKWLRPLRTNNDRCFISGSTTCKSESFVEVFFAQSRYIRALITLEKISPDDEKKKKVLYPFMDAIYAA